MEYLSTQYINKTDKFSKSHFFLSSITILGYWNMKDFMSCENTNYDYLSFNLTAVHFGFKSIFTYQFINARLWSSIVLINEWIPFYKIREIVWNILIKISGFQIGFKCNSFYLLVSQSSNNFMLQTVKLRGKKLLYVIWHYRKTL